MAQRRTKYLPGIHEINGFGIRSLDKSYDEHDDAGYGMANSSLDRYETSPGGGDRDQRDRELRDRDTAMRDRERDARRTIRLSPLPFQSPPPPAHEPQISHPSPPEHTWQPRAMSTMPNMGSHLAGAKHDIVTQENTMEIQLINQRLERMDAGLHNCQKTESVLISQLTAMQDENKSLVMRINVLTDAIRQREEQIVRLNSQVGLVRQCMDDHVEYNDKLSLLHRFSAEHDAKLHDSFQNLEKLNSVMEGRHASTIRDMTEVHARMSTVAQQLQQTLTREHSALSERIHKVEGELHTESHVRSQAVNGVSDAVQDVSLVVIELQQKFARFKLRSHEMAENSALREKRQDEALQDLHQQMVETDHRIQQQLQSELHLMEKHMHTSMSEMASKVDGKVQHSVDGANRVIAEMDRRLLQLSKQLQTSSIKSDEHLTAIVQRQEQFRRWLEVLQQQRVDSEIQLTLDALVADVEGETLQQNLRLVKQSQTTFEKEVRATLASNGDADKKHGAELQQLSDDIHQKLAVSSTDILQLNDKAATLQMELTNATIREILSSLITAVEVADLDSYADDLQQDIETLAETQRVAQRRQAENHTSITNTLEQQHLESEIHLAVDMLVQGVERQALQSGVEGMVARQEDMVKQIAFNAATIQHHQELFAQTSSSAALETMHKQMEAVSIAVLQCKDEMGELQKVQGLHEMQLTEYIAEHDQQHDKEYQTLAQLNDEQAAKVAAEMKALQDSLTEYIAEHDQRHDKENQTLAQINDEQAAKVAAELKTLQDALTEYVAEHDQQHDKEYQTLAQLNDEQSAKVADELKTLRDAHAELAVKHQEHSEAQLTHSNALSEMQQKHQDHLDVQQKHADSLATLQQHQHQQLELQQHDNVIASLQKHSQLLDSLQDQQVAHAAEQQKQQDVLASMQLVHQEHADLHQKHNEALTLLQQQHADHVATQQKIDETVLALQQQQEDLRAIADQQDIELRRHQQLHDQHDETQLETREVIDQHSAALQKHDELHHDHTEHAALVIQHHEELANKQSAAADAFTQLEATVGAWKQQSDLQQHDQSQRADQLEMQFQQFHERLEVVEQSSQQSSQQLLAIEKGCNQQIQQMQARMLQRHHETEIRGLMDNMLLHVEQQDQNAFADDLCSDMEELSNAYSRLQRTQAENIRQIQANLAQQHEESEVHLTMDALIDGVERKHMSMVVQQIAQHQHDLEKRLPN
eukprot:TRINITY_DN1276_c0_g2_i1.p1 TRINITY_DN1276_c0_g2~~TRINITY_DN1276_c0_g2_i1.p1  ORF type:complete len:1232 (+),score=394.64 TRINITY_DN1276_c0_g2_i1:49-3696(+)